MKRAASQKTSKKMKLYKSPNPNRTGETKFTNTPFSSNAFAMYLNLTDIATSGERNGRIGTKIYLTNVHIQFMAKFTGSGSGPLALRLVVAQSKQGMLTGTAGITDATTFTGEANHDMVKILHDEYFPLQYGDGDLSTVVNIRCKINQLLRYKNFPSTDYDCDKPVYFWVRSDNESVIGGTQITGHHQLYWKDV